MNKCKTCLYKDECCGLQVMCRGYVADNETKEWRETRHDLCEEV